MDILHYVRDKYNLALTKGWANYSFLRHQEALRRNTSPRQAVSRLQVPSVFLERTSHNVKLNVHGQAVKLVFGLDEVGCSDWEDRCQKSVIIPKVFKGCAMHHKV
jgi:hypothetical protein